MTGFSQQFNLATEEALLTLANSWGKTLSQGAIIYLQGTLGAGKTTFSRGLLHGIGHVGAVKSPTYTLVEPYDVNGSKIYHFDLYRLGHPEELEYLGIRDYLSDDALWLVEWPQRGEGYIPPADITLTLEPNGSGRDLTISAHSQRGEELARKICI
ncbi:MAG: tRNA threonylcarbamoyladenosine biosynthesis protein TsaE [Chitinophagales bacterium]|jgi:tRNA threonylcarbamoyladenosine biosynthesis protein TsaE|tara:strand:+ start:18 stop:485 length:468 start_codon:yes stop_codon:yes gene_type:complete